MSSQTLPYRGPDVEKLPLRERINYRLVFFIAVIALLVGYPVYQFVEMKLTGGIKQAAGGYTQVDLKAMSTFAFDQADGTINDVPEKWRQLDGKKVILHGEMWEPMGAGPHVTDFQLVYSIAKCCFSGPPQIQHFVHSRALPDAKLAYYEGTVEVRGILHVDVKQDQGRVTSVYQLDVESVKPAR